MALLSTLNGLFSSYGAVFAQASKDGWYPKCVSKLNKNGQPVVLLTISTIVAVVPLMLDFSIQTVTNSIILLTLFVDLFPCLAVCMLPKKYPEAWKQSVVHMPKAGFICLMTISLCVQLACAYWSARGLSVVGVIVSLVCIAICFVYGYFKGKDENCVCPNLSEEFLD